MNLDSGSWLPGLQASGVWRTPLRRWVPGCRAQTADALEPVTPGFGKAASPGAAPQSMQLQTQRIGTLPPHRRVRAAPPGALPAPPLCATLPPSLRFRGFPALPRAAVLRVRRLACQGALPLASARGISWKSDGMRVPAPDSGATAWLGV